MSSNYLGYWPDTSRAQIPKSLSGAKKKHKEKTEVYARCEDTKRILRILAFAGTSTANLKLAW
jgi:hypothetical protein